MTSRALSSVLALSMAACGGGGDGDDAPGPDAPPSAWSERAPVIGGALQETAAVVLDGRIYVIGGFSASGGLDGGVRIYDTATDTWSMGPALPAQLHHANVALVGDTIFVLGGLAGASFMPTNAAWSWAPATETSWRERPGARRGAGVVGVIDGVIYVAGGLSRGATASLASFDPATDTWSTELPPMPGPRDHACGAVIDGTLYVAGGRDGAIDAVFASVFAFTPGQGWSERALMPTGRGGTACGVIDGRLVVVGGEGNPDAGSGVFPEVEVYDPVADAWQSLPPMAVPRHGMSAGAWDGTLYVPGGATTDGFGAVDHHDALRVRSP